jgi:hypothetical protein
MPPPNRVGQMTPAMYWPEEISAIAVPRRRSNQRLIPPPYQIDLAM